MQRFQYKHGDKPLAGYTIERAAGRGGFGEVYYALSDSGRQVALKVIQNYEQIELRGISQCMNLKSPHLVTIFDVKHNDQQIPFVIMEYVSGPSLRGLLDESLEGLGVQKAAFFLREIAKGLSFLHECGIVHRDLKPGNIFYENGYVKIGDYGLSKLISSDRQSQQTVTVGTVHYMAPEVGQGCYDRSIDIYALGVLLYEMLTGEVPFFGSSPSEILMKHLTVEPDLKGIDETFARVIRKAMAKDPADRYETVQQMVEDVFGSDHIRNSVSQFSPDSLSVIAQRIGGDLAKPRPTPSEPAKQKTSTADASGDPIDRRQRRWLARIAIIGMAFGIGIFCPSEQYGYAILAAVMILGASWGIWHMRFRLNMHLQQGTMRRLGFGGLASLLLVSFSGLFLFLSDDLGIDLGGGPAIQRTYIAIILALFGVNWHTITLPGRKQRVSLKHAVLAGLIGLVLAVIFGGLPQLAIGVLAGISLVVQIACPFDPKVTRTSKPAKAPVRAAQTPPARKNSVRLRLLPHYVRLLWVLGFLLLLANGLLLVIWAGVGNLRGDDFAVAVSIGVSSLIFSLFCLFKSFRIYFTGWYRYLIKPIVLMIFVSGIVSASICLGTLQLDSAETLGALFLIILPAILFLFIAIVPSRLVENLAVPKEPISPTIRATAMVSPYKRVWALILSGGMFLSVFGLQRFYVGKIGTGILWLLSFGLFGIGQIIDIIMILTGHFKDCYGFPLIIWENPAELKQPSKSQPPDAPAQPPGIPDVVSSNADPADRTDTNDQRIASRASNISVHSFEPFNLVSFIFAAVGNIILLLAILLGLAIALHIPAMIAAGLPDPSVAEELNKFFGYTGWCELFERIGSAITIIILLLAMVFIIIARRNSGAAHILRAVLGLLGLWVTLSLLAQAVPGTYSPEIVNMFNNDQPGPALEILLGQTQQPALIISGILFTLSMIILAWPARRRGQAFVPAPVQGVENDV